MKHEALTAVVRKVEGDALFVQKQIEAAQEKQVRTPAAAPAAPYRAVAYCTTPPTFLLGLASVM